MSGGKPIEYDRILLRYGELALKSDHVRRRFEDRLLGNIRSGLDRNDVDYEIEKEMGRIYVITEEIEESIEILRKVFGLVSISPVRTEIVGSSLDDVVDTAGEIAGEYIDEDDTFAIRARRTGNQNFTSQSIEREAGSRVIEVTDADVDLDDPDKTLYIEVRQNRAFFYLEVVDCPGGLPLGTQGKVVVLFSGSMDSLVASWLMMKRGSRVLPVYFEGSPYTDEKMDERAEEGFETVRSWAYGDHPSLVKVSHGKALFLFDEECKSEYLDILSKRQMVRVAGRIAEEEDAEAIVTGDCLNQSVSETVRNLGIVDMAADLPVFRPLITWDKEEIQRLAREIGGIDSATEEVEEPPHSRRPKPAAPLEEIEEEEGKVDIESLAEEALEGATYES